MNEQNKRLTPLEALEKIEKCLFWSDEGLEDLSIIKKDLKKLDALQPLLSFLREHISASNIRGECHITMRGKVGEISKELFDSIQELFK